MAEANGVYYERVLATSGIPIIGLPEVPVWDTFMASKDLCIKLHITGQWVVIVGQAIGGCTIWLPTDAIKGAYQMPKERAEQLYPNQNAPAPAPPMPTAKRKNG